MEAIYCFKTRHQPQKVSEWGYVTNYLTDTMHVRVIREYRLEQPIWDQPLKTSYVVEPRQETAQLLIKQLRPTIILDNPEQLNWSHLPTVVAHLLLMGP